MKKEGVDDYASTYLIGAAATPSRLSDIFDDFAPGHTVVTVRHRSRMNELNLVLVPSNTNTTKVLRPESKLSALPDIFELDKPDSSLLPNREDPVPGTNSPDGQETHPIVWSW